MARGLISGLVVGGVLSVLGLGTVSLLSPLPPSPDVAVEPGGVTSPTESDGGDRPAAGRDADVVEIPPRAPGTEAGSDDLTSMEDADTDPAARPAVGGDADGPLDPQADGQSPEVNSTEDAAAEAGQGASVPGDPGAADRAPTEDGTAPAERPSVGDATAGLQSPSDAGSTPDVTGIIDPPSVSVDPAGLAEPGQEDAPISALPTQPRSPDVADTGSGFGTAPEVGQTPEVAAVADPTISSGDPSGGTGSIADPSVDGTPDRSTDPAAKPDAGGTDPAQPAPVDGATDAGTASPEQPVTAPAVSADAPAQPSPSPEQPNSPEPAEPPAPRVAALPQTGEPESTEESGPTIGTRVTPLTERNGGGSLIGSGSTDPSATDTGGEPPAIQRYAAAFEPEEDKPLMSIVLIDNENSLGAEALQEFPYPLTFALDPNDPEAIEKLTRYRTAGFEVALLTNLPGSFTPQDAEVALGAALAALPETVALVEGVGSGFQGNRPLSNQVTAIAEGTGRGLVTQRNGLNTVQKLAVRKGVPAAVVFRDFDGAGQNVDTIRRFLDQAAFRADQEGAVVMLGRVRPDTISALLLWGLQDRASRVSLAPLSAALLYEPTQQ